MKFSKAESEQCRTQRAILDGKHAEALAASDAFRRRYVLRRPAKYSGRMLYFAREADAMGKRQYRPYGVDAVPLTACNLSPLSFCVWMLTSQLPYLSPGEVWTAVSAMEAEGMISTINEALRIICNNSF
eukprot:9500451-Pyramimonas_sp.AAC.3